ncbi:MAG: helix-turn-helix transcriptional regulator [Chitinophagaceae bacterium]
MGFPLKPYSSRFRSLTMYFDFKKLELASTPASAYTFPVLSGPAVKRSRYVSYFGVLETLELKQSLFNLGLISFTNERITSTGVFSRPGKFTVLFMQEGEMTFTGKPEFTANIKGGHFTIVHIPEGCKGVAQFGIGVNKLECLEVSLSLVEGYRAINKAFGTLFTSIENGPGQTLFMPPLKITGSIRRRLHELREMPADAFHQLSFVKSMTGLFLMHYSMATEQKTLTSFRRAGYFFSEDQVAAIHKVRELIKDDNEPFHTVKELAVLSSMNSTKLREGYKFLFGETIREEERKSRMKRAERLILGTDTPVSEIAILLKYKSKEVFIRSFKRYFGITPGAFRIREQKKMQM